MDSSRCKGKEIRLSQCLYIFSMLTLANDKFWECKEIVILLTIIILVKPLNSFCSHEMMKWALKREVSHLYLCLSVRSYLLSIAYLHLRSASFKITYFNNSRTLDWYFFHFSHIAILHVWKVKRHFGNITSYLCCCVDRVKCNNVRKLSSEFLNNYLPS